MNENMSLSQDAATMLPEQAQNLLLLTKDLGFRASAMGLGFSVGLNRKP